MHGTLLSDSAALVETRKSGEKRAKGRKRDSKPSEALAILMSSAVRIRAMRVELKCTVLSSATGRSIRSSLCERANQG